MKSLTNTPLDSPDTDVRVLVVDDHTLTSQGIVMSVNAVEGFRVVGTLPGGRGVIETLQRERVDITILDLDLPDVDGFSLLAELCGGLDATVIVLSGTGRTSDFDRALRTGARAVVGKADTGDDLELALIKARDGERYVSNSIAARLEAQNSPDIILPPRQLTILSMLSAGETNKEIGHKLGIAAPTVSFHISEIRKRLSVESNRKIVPRAKELGII